MTRVHFTARRFFAPTNGCGIEAAGVNVLGQHIAPAPGVGGDGAAASEDQIQNTKKIHNK